MRHASLTAPVLLLLAAAGPLAGLPARADDRSAGFVKEGEEAAEAREFAVAAQKFAAALAADPAAPDRAAVAGRREDMELANEGLEALVRAVGADPGRFGKVDLGRGITVNLRSADALGVTATLTGGTTQIRWSSMDRRLLAALVERAKPSGPEALPLAALLRAAGAEDEAEGMLLHHLREGGEPRRVSRIWARWRGEEVPPGGFVEHEGSLVSLEDRDRMLLEDRKAAAYGKLLGEDPVRRREGFEELKALGEPARWTLYKGLRARRALVAARLAGLKVFTSPSTRAGLKKELENRRREALAFIEDAKRYPYPSETHQGQPEVDRLVARVREVWSHPFDTVAGWDPEVGEGLKAIAEVDALIASVEPDYRPDMEAVKGPVNALLAVPSLVPDGYSAEVLAYNRKVRTTADAEERENVAAVNEYRMMMGRRALRIHERLVRAARGHSRHMVRNGYFSHDNEFPGLENPGKRAAAQGYTGGVGENIAAGRPTGRGAFDAWFHSAGHHRNMVGAGWTEMGAGRFQADFTQLFGRAGGSSLAEPDPLPPPEPEVEPDPSPPAVGEGE